MSKLCSAILAAAALIAPLLSHAQVDRVRTWDVYGGVAANQSTSAGNTNWNYGFDGSLAQRSDIHHWVGGMVAGSAIYSKLSTTAVNGSKAYVPGATFYTVGVGPVFATRFAGIAPTGHALFGVVNTKTTPQVAAGQTAVSFTTNHFGSTIGGGFDFPISRGHHAALRTQADWVRVWQSDAANVDMLKVSAGLLYSFY